MQNDRERAGYPEEKQHIKQETWKTVLALKRAESEQRKYLYII